MDVDGTASHGSSIGFWDWREGEGRSPWCLLVNVRPHCLLAWDDISLLLLLLLCEEREYHHNCNLRLRCIVSVLC